MNRLLSVRIENYRSCSKTEIDFKEPLTTLVGINGSGKTNILSAIANLARRQKNAETDIGQLQKILGRDPSIVSADLEVEGKTISLKAEFFTEFDEYHENIRHMRLQYRLKGGRGWKTINSEFLEYARYLDRAEYYNLRFHRSFDKRLTSQDAKLQRSIISLLDDITYFSATKFADPTKTPASIELRADNTFRGYNRGGVHGEFLRDLNTSKKDGVAFERYKDVVGKNGLGLVDDITIEDAMVSTISGKVLVGGQLQNQESISRFIVPRVHIDGNGLSFSQLSEGTFKTLALVFYILNSDKEVLLIEEPEVCVHHGLLASLIELIKDESATKQIIVSTHSDFVLNKLRPENIVVVTKELDTGTLARSLDKAMEKNDYMYLKRYLNEEGNLGQYWRESGFLNE